MQRARVAWPRQSCPWEGCLAARANRLARPARQGARDVRSRQAPSTVTPAHTGTLPEGRRARPRAPAEPGRLRAASTHALSEWSHSPQPPRSEEHTSELQSQSNLVCRLLLEKKKIKGEGIERRATTSSDRRDSSTPTQ